jgi:UDP-glucose 4-epimerase
MMRRCLVTGGRGFLGFHTVTALERAGFQVVAPPRSELDTTREEDWARFDGAFDALVHLAAFVPAAAAGPSDVPRALQEGALATHYALRWAERLGVRRVVYASSADVYRTPATLPIAEDACTDPSGAAAYYGLAKLWGDQLCRLFRASMNRSVVALRMSAFHGARMRNRGVVAAFWRRAGAGEPLGVRAPEASGDYLYVKDAARAVVAAVEAEAPGGVYNIGSGRETTLEALAHAIWTTRQGSAPIRIELGAESGRRFVLDIARASTELGWKPSFDLASGLADWANEER